jgi:serine phosphatase RsbU (regulator of sigma subunit)
MKKLFQPSVSIMNRLKYPQKFGLISFVFILPISLLMYLLFSELQHKVDFAQKEMVGNRYLRPLRQLSKNVLDHQVKNDRIQRMNQDSQLLDSLKSTISVNLDDLENVDKTAEPELNLTENYQPLKRLWKQFEENHAVWSLETQAEFHDQLLSQINQLRSEIGDRSNLILNQDLDGFYLVDATLIKLPEIQNLLARIRLVNQQILLAKEMTPLQRSELITLAGSLQKTNEDLMRKMDTAFSHNSTRTLRPQLSQDLNHLNQKLRKLTYQVNQLAYTNQSVQTDVYIAQSNQGLDQSFVVWDKTIDELDTLLQRQIDGYLARQRYVTLFVVLVLAIAAYLFITFYLGTMQVVSQLSGASQRMVDGSNHHSTVTLDCRDELADVVRSFNTVADALRNDIARRKQAEAEIVQLSQQLKDENLRMSAELEVTRRLQQMLLPADAELAAIADLEIAGFMEPAAEVGGDYYDVLQQDGKVRISIGDVTGHGLESGMVMVMAQTAVRTLLANGETNPVKFLNAVNQIIYDNTRRMQSLKNMTLLLLEYEAGTLSFSGQHEELIIVRKNGTIEQIDTFELGFPLGLEADITSFVGQATVHLEAGDVAVLYTDGITEAMNVRKEQYGLEQIHNVLKKTCHLSAQEIRKALIEDLMSYIGNQKIFDDITLVVLRRK